MSIHLTCPGCRAKLEIDDSQGGHKIQCPECNAQMDVPGTYVPPLSFHCNHCGADLEVNAYMAGQMINCMHCGGAVFVPALKGQEGAGGCLGLVSVIIIGCGSLLWQLL
jgi:DNA-directed RNA polymerase subunit RPC12/RpoP